MAKGAATRTGSHQTRVNIVFSCQVLHGAQGCPGSGYCCSASHAEAPQTDVGASILTSIMLQNLWVLECMHRYLGDSGQAQFVAEKLEAAAVPPPAASGSTAADTSSSRPGTSSSVLGRFGYYDAWTLLDLLLVEWLHQAWARVQRMHDLRRCALPNTLQCSRTATSACATHCKHLIFKSAASRSGS